MSLVLLAGCDPLGRQYGDEEDLAEEVADEAVAPRDMKAVDLRERDDIEPTVDAAVPDDLAVEPDLAVPADLSASVDGTAPRDLAPPRDLTGVAVDLAASADLAVPPDLVVRDLVKAPDLVVRDLVVPPDLVVRDLVPQRDLVPPRDLVTPPDMVKVPTGRCTPSINGSLGTDWTAEALLVENKTATNWGTSNELKSLRVCYDATNLYLGVAGVVSSLNALEIVIDIDYGKSTGVTAPSQMTDVVGSSGNPGIDKAITGKGAWVAWAPRLGFGAEFAWATMGMTSADNAYVNDAGLRAISNKPSDFAWVQAQKTVCSTPNRACEVQIPWSSLYGGMLPANSRLALFGRLVSGDGTAMSNQTVPEDMPAAPGNVGLYMSLAPKP